jgi:hypothetical protein
MSKRKIQSKKLRFKTITFKLSPRQYNSLKNFSALEKTSPLKVIKKRIRDCIEEYSDEQLGKEMIAKNQLTLFDNKAEEEKQMELFE